MISEWNWGIRNEWTLYYRSSPRESVPGLEARTIRESKSCLHVLDTETDHSSRSPTHAETQPIRF